MIEQQRLAGAQTGAEQRARGLVAQDLGQCRAQVVLGIRISAADSLGAADRAPLLMDAVAQPLPHDLDPG